MITYITVEDVNSILGATWTDESKKAKSVLMANTWMNGLNLKLPCDKATHETIIPDDVNRLAPMRRRRQRMAGCTSRKPVPVCSPVNRLMPTA